MTVRVSADSSVLVLSEELERRIVVAARLSGLDPAAFIVAAARDRCADVLAEEAGSAGQARRMMAHVWKRPAPGPSARPRPVCCVR